MVYSLLFFVLIVSGAYGNWELALKDLSELFRKFNCGEENQCIACDECNSMCKFYNNSCCQRKDEHLIPILEKWQYECIRIYPDMELMGFDCNGKYSDEVAAGGVLMVTKCPLIWEGSDIQTKCEYEIDTLLSRIPVYENNREYITYKNVYCAFCNDIAFDRLRFWEIEVQCNYSDNVNIVENFDRDSCVTYYVSRGIWGSRNYRWCSTKMIETCSAFYYSNLSVIDMRDRCENGQTWPIIVGSDSFKNLDCWVCNQPDLNLTESVVKDLFGVNLGFINPDSPQICARTYRPCFDEIPTYSLKQLVNLNLEEEDDGTFLLRNLKENSLFNRKPGIITCKTCADIQCKHYEIAKKDVEMNETGIYLPHLNVFFTKDRYFVNDTKMYLCLDETQHAYLMKVQTSNLGKDLVGSALTFVGLIASLTCLFLTFFLYLYFKKLRNDHGRIMLNLVISLFLAQLLFLLSFSFQNIKSACVLSGVLTHYFFLVAFCAMNVVGIHSFRTFSNLLANDPRGHRVLLCVIYSWTVPLFFVITAVVLDYVYLPKHVAPFRPQFGEKTCWINSSKALLVFFIVPLALFKAIDVIFFSTTAVIIARHIRRGSKLNSTTKANRCSFLINLKLALIMGLCWMFSFIATSVDNLVLWYLFIVCNSLQGLFIFLSLVCSRNVCSLMNQRMKSFSGTTTGNTNMKVS
ncbi:probable G-protein coupled receptor Mth-like 3 [Ruditapes philippinarum]|uniref:probable G-protein coupled receptor Mth-like 3 n=1 Tax=Ruditapes philippinarum TaxID=129788 RepID=UPI00295BF7CB|nr:probable G-protein coupled receptor Mth-like 3 [Ruditapes philippinarum]